MQVKDLKANPKNPRKISKKRLEMLQRSIDKFGDLSGFVFNRRSGTLVSGHQRSKTIPGDAKIVIEARHETPTPARTVAEGYVLIHGERFKYREVDADATWETEALLAANRHGGEWDNDLLRLAIGEVGDVELAGFTIPELKELKIEMPDIGPVAGTDEEADAKYVRETPKTEEQIPVERPSNVKTSGGGFDQVEEQTEIKGKRFVIIIDCPNQDVKDSLKEKLKPEILDSGCKIF